MQIRQRKLSPTRRANLCKSVGNMMTLHGDFSDDSDEDLRDKPKPLKSSRSVSSLGDSFVVVGNLQAPNSENKMGQHKPDCGFKKEPRNPLREGMLVSSGFELALFFYEGYSNCIRSCEILLYFYFNMNFILCLKEYCVLNYILGRNSAKVSSIWNSLICAKQCNH